MIKALAFDRGDVCGDYDLSRFDKFLSQNGYDPQKEKVYFKRYKGDFDRAKISEKEFWTGLKKALGFKESTKTLMQNCNKNLIVNRQLLRIIRSLRKKYFIALRSNMDITAIRHIKEEVDLTKFFDHIYFSWHGKTGKTEKRILKEIEKECRCQASDILFVDDTPAVIEKLKHYGAQGILYKGFSDLQKQLKKIGILNS